ncbi:MAG TPA: hypothetical protein ENK02_13960 [Planctomycetes bacterium]|nr:hypothetical protein [Planctomycetota bacterium]
MQKPILVLIFSLLSEPLWGQVPVPVLEARPETPHIDCVVPLPDQPQAKDPAMIWYDDFDGKPIDYAEGKSPLDSKVAFGRRGRSLLMHYPKGSRGIGNRKVFFGDSPAYRNKVVRPGERFDEVYWRIYVKHQYGWEGGPAKMSRATSLVNNRWAQAMIAHVWSGASPSLTLDPATGVRGARVVTRHYNDFKRLKWLGNRPVSKFPIHATSESGYWVLVESRAKLNTPGKSDGINQLWIDGRLECERRNLNFRGSYKGHGINAVFLEAYWNQGSPKTQSRWFDNFVISTKAIGPVSCPKNPVVYKTPYHGPGRPGRWELQAAGDFEGRDVVFRSKLLPPSEKTVIDKAHGAFVGSLKGKKALAPGKTYYLRVRQSSAGGVFSGWSRWHQGFRVR